MMGCIFPPDDNNCLDCWVCTVAQSALCFFPSLRFHLTLLFCGVFPSCPALYQHGGLLKCNPIRLRYIDISTASIFDILLSFQIHFVFLETNAISAGIRLYVKMWRRLLNFLEDMAGRRILYGCEICMNYPSPWTTAFLKTKIATFCYFVK